MTSTSELDVITECACGCGRPIGPRDDHPWFKSPACQALWLATQDVPVDEQAQFAWDLRFYHELWMETPWTMCWWVGALTDRDIIGLANGRLGAWNLRPIRHEDPDALADALKINSYYAWANVRGARTRKEMFPDWAYNAWYRNRAIPPPSIQEALKQYSLTPQSVPADLVGPS